MWHSQSFWTRTRCATSQRTKRGLSGPDDCMPREVDSRELQKKNAWQKQNGSPSQPSSWTSTDQRSIVTRFNYRLDYSAEVYSRQLSSQNTPTNLLTANARLNRVLPQHRRSNISWYHSRFPRRLYMIGAPEECGCCNRDSNITSADNTVSCPVTAVLKNKMASHIDVDNVSAQDYLNNEKLAYDHIMNAYAAYTSLSVSILHEELLRAGQADDSSSVKKTVCCLWLGWG